MSINTKKNKKNRNNFKSRKLLRGGSSTNNQTIKLSLEKKFYKEFSFELIAAIGDAEVDIQSGLEMIPFTYYTVHEDYKSKLNKILLNRDANGHFGEVFQVNLELSNRGSSSDYILKTNIVKNKKNPNEVKNK